MTEQGNYEQASRAIDPKVFPCMETRRLSVRDSIAVAQVQATLALVDAIKAMTFEQSGPFARLTHGEDVQRVY